MTIKTEDVKVKIKFSQYIWILSLVSVPLELFEIKDEDAVGEFVTRALKDYEWDYVILDELL